MAAINVYLFSVFTKRVNSTAQPTLAQGVQVQCRFRDSYNILTPGLVLDLRGQDGYINPAIYTYAYIPDMQRYYWIDDWRFASGLWYASLSVDVLASHKTSIGSTSIYAQRLADRLKNGVVTDSGITDTMIPTIATPSYNRNRAATSPFVRSLASGTYVIGVINNDGVTAGSVAYYCMTPAQFASFRQSLMGDGWVSSTAEMSADTTKAILNPIQYITSCQWFPLAIGSIEDSTATYIGMRLGWWQMTPPTGVDPPNYQRIRSDGMARFYINIPVPVHPQYSTTNQRMLRCAPFSTYLLHLPYFGSTPVDYEDFASGTIGALFEIDIISGKGSVQLYNGTISSTSDFPDLRLVLQMSCQVSTPIQLSQVISDTWAAQVTEMQTDASIAADYGMLQKEYIDGISSMVNTVMDIPGVLSGGMSPTAALRDAVNMFAQAEKWGESQYVVEKQVKATSAAGLYSSFAAKAPRVTSQGANGSLLGSWCPIEISGRFLLLSTTASEIYAKCGYAAGWPTTIGEHTGYVQGLLSEFHAAGCLKAECTAIKAAIEAGIYYE